MKKSKNVRRTYRDDPAGDVYGVFLANHINRTYDLQYVGTTEKKALGFAKRQRKLLRPLDFGPGPTVWHPLPVKKVTRHWFCPRRNEVQRVSRITLNESRAKQPHAYDPFEVGQQVRDIRALET